tara:strand:- start:54 stop:263 length:210 start_codon:yes stop_codon:yes gene_type:complete
MYFTTAIVEDYEKENGELIVDTKNNIIYNINKRKKYNINLTTEYINNVLDIEYTPPEKIKLEINEINNP